MQEFIVSNYLNDLFDITKRNKIIKKLLRQIRYLRLKQQVDGIVVRGVSGLLIGPIIAHKTKLPLAIIRKEDDSHSPFRIEGIIKTNYIILDDLINTGNTIKTIIEQMKKTLKNERSYKQQHLSPQCVGIFLYHTDPLYKMGLDNLKQWRKELKLSEQKIPIFCVHSRLTKEHYI